MAKQELLTTPRDRYQALSKEDRSRILDEFTTVAAITVSMVSGSWLN